MKTEILATLVLITGCGGGAERSFTGSASDAAPASDAAGGGAPSTGKQDAAAGGQGGAAATTDAGTGSQGGAAATTDAGTGSQGCTAGAVRCSGHQPQTCVGGVWLANGSLCTGTLPGCLDGVCVECDPGEHSCADGTHPETCDATGQWVLDAVACTGGQQCSAGTCVTLCCGTAICDFGAQWCPNPAGGSLSCIGPCQIGATCSSGLVAACP